MNHWGTSPPALVLLAAVLCGGAAWGAGRRLARLLGLPVDASLAFLLGAPVLSLAMLGLAASARLSLAAVLALGLAAIAAGAPYAFRRPSIPAWPRWVTGIAVCYAALYLLNALAPEISPDGMTYHANLPRRYWEAGGLIPILTSVYAQMPQGMEMLYVFVYPIGGAAACAVVHLLFLVALSALASREIEGRYSWIPVLLLACTPVVGIDAASAYNDVALAACAFGAFVCARRWNETNHTGWLVAAGWLAGFCFALKYTGALAILMVMAVAWRALRRPLLVAALLLPAAARVGWWLAKNYWFVGNPVSPFANVWFDNPVFDLRQETEYLEQLRPAGDWWVLARNVLYQGENVGGILGPVFALMLVLAIVALGRAAARPYLLAAALWAAPFAANAGTRFLIPALPFLVVAVVRAIPARWLMPVALAHALACWPAALDLYAPANVWRHTEIPWRAALGLEPAESFLSRRLAGVNTLKPLQGRRNRVLTLSGFYDSLTTARLLNATAARGNLDLATALWAAASRRPLPQSRVRFWFPTQPLRALRLRKQEGEPVALARLTVYDLLRPIPRSPGWTASASKNGHFADRVLDGSLLTRWYSSTRPGEPVTLEVAFGETVTCNRLDVDLDSTEQLPPMQLEGQLPGGEWSVLRTHWEQGADPLPAQDLRLEALSLLHENRIGFVLIQNRDHAHEIRAFDESFEVFPFRYERVAADGPARLYQVVRSLVPATPRSTPIRATPVPAHRARPRPAGAGTSTSPSASGS